MNYNRNCQRFLVAASLVLVAVRGRPLVCSIMAVEDRLNQSLDDIIKRNRETSKPKPKAGSKQGGERKGRGSFRDDGRNGRDARVAVVRVTQTKRPAGGAAGGRRGRTSSGTFVDYDGSLHVVSIVPARCHVGLPAVKLMHPPPNCFPRSIPCSRTEHAVLVVSCQLYTLL